MDIIDFFKQQVDKWNDDNAKDKCWVYGAPLFESEMNKFQTPDRDDNIQKPTDLNCCVHVFLTDLRVNTQLNYAPDTGLVNEKRCTWNFNLNLLQKDKLGENVYNEIKGYDLTQSKWEQYLKDIYDFVTCQKILEFCNILGYDVRITRFEGNPKINWLDENYTGWQYGVTLELLE